MTVCTKIGAKICVFRARLNQMNSKDGIEIMCIFDYLADRIEESDPGKKPLNPSYVYK